MPDSSELQWSSQLVMNAWITVSRTDLIFERFQFGDDSATPTSNSWTENRLFSCVLYIDSNISLIIRGAWISRMIRRPHEHSVIPVTSTSLRQQHRVRDPLLFSTFHNKSSSSSTMRCSQFKVWTSSSAPVFPADSTLHSRRRSITRREVMST